MRNHRFLVGGAITVCFLGFFLVLKGDMKVNSEPMDEPAGSELMETYLRLPLHFIKNEGQVDEKVKFYERGARHSTFFTEDGVYLSLLKGEEAVTVGLAPVNGREKQEIIGEGRLEGKVNYFIGNNREKWKTNIPTFGVVRYVNIYDNIDIRFYGNNREIEYDVVIRPGGDPSRVRFSWEGIDRLRVTEEGDLFIDIRGGNLIQKRPSIYQEMDGRRVEIAGGFRVYDRNTYGFQLASYTEEHPLIIDPVLVYSTYLGGSDWDWGYGIAVDGSGNVYLTGLTDSTDFPTQAPFQPNNAGGLDAFVTKIHPSGDTLVYSTYLGGSYLDYGYGIAVEGSGSVYLTGSTGSTDFPTQAPLQPNNAGSEDAFVTKISPSGDALLYSSYLGGSDWDRGYDIAVDGSGNAYLTGPTYSTDFPTQAPLQPNNAGEVDAFVTKINPSGDALLYSSYLGGSGVDYGYGIAVEGSGSVYLTGYTDSTDFPTQAPLQPNNAGEVDAFVTKLTEYAAVPTIITGLGSYPSDGGWIEVCGGDYSHDNWLRIGWGAYNSANGEARIATGDIDGDGRDEIIIGLGPVPGDPTLPGGWFQVLDNDYTHLGWGRINWGSYNSVNGESWPACGDVDGDGRDEIIIGLGPYPVDGGWFEIFDYTSPDVTHKAWRRLNWGAYNSQSGETRPACGDIDGDDRDEIVIGLGDGGGGWLEVFDDALAGYVHLGWPHVHWGGYCSGNGETWPAVKR